MAAAAQMRRMHWDLGDRVAHAGRAAHRRRHLHHDRAVVEARVGRWGWGVVLRWQRSVAVRRQRRRVGVLRRRHVVMLCAAAVHGGIVHAGVRRLRRVLW